MMHIHYWRTNEVARQLTEGKLSGREEYGYLLLSQILATLFSYYNLYICQYFDWRFVTEYLVILVIVILGLTYCYHINGGRSGQSFILRFACLSVPVGIRIGVISVVVSVLVYEYYDDLMWVLGAEDLYIGYEFVVSGIVAFFTLLYFYMISQALKRVQR